MNDNPYYIGYNIMTTSLKNENIFEGLTKSLNIINEYMNSNGVILYKLKDDGEYHHYANNSNIKYNLNNITELLKVYKERINNNKYLDIEINDQKIKGITGIQINLKENKKYIPFILNNNKHDEELIDILNQTFTIILEKIELFDKIKELSEEDALTKLGNRMKYINKLEEISNNNKNIVYTILDLFRLKYINDNIGHDAGDLYIENTAKILKKYFPKYKYELNEQGNIIKKETGHNLYRIGGDEFAIISENSTKEEVNEEIIKASTEVENISLDTYHNLTLGLNYGISERTNQESIESLYKKADKELSKDKEKMYKTKKINRRR